MYARVSFALYHEVALGKARAHVPAVQAALAYVLHAHTQWKSAQQRLPARLLPPMYHSDSRPGPRGHDTMVPSSVTARDRAACCSVPTMPPTRARASGPAVSPSRVRATRRTLSNETNRIGARRVVRPSPSAAPPACVAAPSAHMHDLFQLEKERVQASQTRERAERDQRNERHRIMDAKLVEARRTANENRPPAPGWRGYNDYEVDLLRAEHQRETEALHARLHAQELEIDALRAEAAHHAQLREEASASDDALRARVTELESLLATTDTRSAALASEVSASAERMRTLEVRLADAEALRRRLHNQVQELRGNVRVYARVRPPRNDGVSVELRYPDALQLATQLEVRAPSESAMGAASIKTHHFAFDHVFPPSATQADVFEHVSDLLQSVLDGYHVRPCTNADHHLCLWANGLRQDTHPRGWRAGGLGRAQHLGRRRRGSDSSCDALSMGHCAVTAGAWLVVFVRGADGRGVPGSDIRPTW